MRKAISTLVASLMLCGALAMAQPAASKTDKDKNKDTQHHSKLSKVKFWNHNKDSKKNAKPAKEAQAKTASAKPAQAKSKQAKSEKQAVAKKDQKQQIAHNMKPAKPGTKSTASHTKSHKSEEPKEKPPLKQ